jgi:raffinose/stachyose/melibiose transport system permease protein
MDISEMKSVKEEKTGFSVFKYALVGLLTAAIVVPLAYILISGFKTSSEISRPLQAPTGLYLGNFDKVFHNHMMQTGIINSIVITFSAIAICIVLCSLAAYPLSRMKSRVFTIIYFVFLSAMMIPAAANLTSIYGMMNSLGLRNTLFGLIFLEAALQIPMGILLYSGFIKNIPRELDEAAMIDGCGYFRRFFSIIFPLLKPVTFSFASLSAIYVWNDFLMPMLVVSENDKKPITLAVYSFVGENMADYGAIYAAMIIAVIPPLVFFLVSQKYLYSGVTAGAVKG